MGKKFTEEEVLERLEKIREKRSLPHLFELIYYRTLRDSEIKVTCLNRNTSETRTFDKYKSSTYGMKCCAISAIRHFDTVLERGKDLKEKVDALAGEREHIISEECFSSRRDYTFTIACEKHQKTDKDIRYRNYASITVTYGIPCYAYPLSVLNSKTDK